MRTFLRPWFVLLCSTKVKKSVKLMMYIILVCPFFCVIVFVFFLLCAKFSILMYAHLQYHINISCMPSKRMGMCWLYSCCRIWPRSSAFPNQEDLKYKRYMEIWIFQQKLGYTLVNLHILQTLSSLYIYLIFTFIQLGAYTKYDLTL